MWYTDSGLSCDFLYESYIALGLGQFVLSQGMSSLAQMSFGPSEPPYEEIGASAVSSLLWFSNQLNL